MIKIILYNLSEIISSISTRIIVEKFYGGKKD